MFGKNKTKVYSTDKDAKILNDKIKIVDNTKSKFESVWDKIKRENREADEKDSQNNNDSIYGGCNPW